MSTVQDRLLVELEQHGYRGKVVSVEHCKDLQKDILELHRAGLLDKEFYNGNLTGFQFDYSKELPGVKSIIIAAIPQPIIKLCFTWKGKPCEVVIPPTYLSTEVDRPVLEIVQHVLTPENYTLLRAKLPLKLLSVRSGLSMYGRNNISYVQGMGSFNRLIAWVTDMPCEDSWQDVKRMPDCDTCHACLRNCPTKCIDAERYLLHAENCLTHLNEYGGEFPDWVDSTWHNAIVGCMHCQTVCPQNRQYSKTVEIRDVFTEEEVSLLLKGPELSKLPEHTRNTLQRLDLIDYYGDHVLSRNLDVLINK